MSLRTGTEMISLSMIFNKITGFYGLLAILTGFSLSPLQLSMYLYSLAGLILLAFLMPHIRKQTPFQCLALAWFYVIDTVVNTGFTAAFAVTWLIAVGTDTTHTETVGSVAGSGAMGKTAAAVERRYAVDGTEAMSNALNPGEDVVAAIQNAAAGTPSLGDAVGVEETIPSIILVVLITLVRVYFIFVVMAICETGSPTAHVLDITHTEDSVPHRRDCRCACFQSLCRWTIRWAGLERKAGATHGQHWRGLLARRTSRRQLGQRLGWSLQDDKESPVWATWHLGVGTQGAERDRATPSIPKRVEGVGWG